MKIKINDPATRRELRVRSKVSGSDKRPRVSVYRSNRYIYAQAIDDVAKKTVGAFSSLKINNKEKKLKKTEIAQTVGTELAKILKTKGLENAVFDRGRYLYKGRVKALAEGLRAGGIKI